MPSQRASENHPFFPQPADRSVRVWRYFSWPRLREALRARSIWFSRADCLGDPCEGTHPAGDAIIYQQSYQRAVAERSVIVPSWPEFHENSVEQNRRTTFISCWQMAASDRVSMWERYCWPKEGGVAIQSSYERLDAAVALRATRLEHSVMLGLMRYFDYDSDQVQSDPANVFSAFMMKKLQYEDEAEVRLVMSSMYGIISDGFYVEANWQKLAERIVVSPFADSSLLGEVEQYCKVRGLEVPVQQSTTHTIHRPYQQAPRLP